jgi:hypothetical protein
MPRQCQYANTNVWRRGPRQEQSERVSMPLLNNLVGSRWCDEHSARPGEVVVVVVPGAARDRDRPSLPFLTD